MLFWNSNAEVEILSRKYTVSEEHVGPQSLRCVMEAPIYSNGPIRSEHNI